MHKNILSLVVGLSLLPASAFALQDNINLIESPYIQEGLVNNPMAAEVTKRTSIRNAAVPSIQLAQSVTPIDSMQQPEQNYLRSIAAEAAKTMTEDTLQSSKQSAAPNLSSQNMPPVPTSHRDKMRFDQIKSIVSEAAANIKTEQLDRQLSQPIEESRNVNSPDKRRQQLREVVFGASSAEDKVNKDYMSILHDEVSSTVVIDEESARRPAVSAAGKRLESMTSSLLESDDAYLYRVRFGDSLWLLAQRFYRDGHRYIELFEANRDMLKNENVLHVGQVLRIPKTGANN